MKVPATSSKRHRTDSQHGHCFASHGGWNVSLMHSAPEEATRSTASAVPPPAGPSISFPGCLGRKITGEVTKTGGTLRHVPIEEAFFELANTGTIAFEVEHCNTVVQVTQHGSISGSSGGVLWETAYALSSLFLIRLRNILPSTSHTALFSVLDLVCPSTGTMSTSRPSVLELGAGCGLVGLVLARIGCQVTLTEIDAALPNLSANVSRNLIPAGSGIAIAARLEWGSLPDIKQVSTLTKSGKYDCVVATDVIFDMQLVEPMLLTMVRLMQLTSTAWICVQQRCVHAHDLFLKLAPQYFLNVENYTTMLAETVWFAGELDCELFRLSGIKQIRS